MHRWLEVTTRAFIAALGIWACSCIASRAQGVTAQVDGRVDDLGWVLTSPWLENAGELRWQREHIQLGTQYLRLHIRIEALPDNIVAVVKLRGENAQEIVYTSDELRTKKAFWSGIIEGGYVLVSFFSAAKPEGVRIMFDQIAYQADGPVPYSTVGDRDDKVPINDPSVSAVVLTVERPVARLRFQKSGRPGVCTGFLISENELMTNQHCIDSEEICSSLVIDFGYQYDKENKLQFGKKFYCDSFDPAKSSADLDFSVVKLSGNPGMTWGFIDVSTAPDMAQGPLFVIQHPAGKPKKVAEMDCEVIEPQVDGHAVGVDFTHTCDTEGGSSGSPIFNHEGKLVGIHHFGFKQGSARGWTKNRGVRMSNVRAWLLGQR